MLVVWPCDGHRQAFAAWARSVGVRTVSSHEFGVPAALFPQIPVQLLDGATVDGRPLAPAPPVPVTATVAAAGPQREPEAPQADGTARTAPEGTTAPDGPPAAAEAPLPAPQPPTAEPVAEPEPVAEQPEATPDPQPAGASDPTPGQLACEHCDRTFTSPHGLRTHTGMAHPGQPPTDPQDPEE